MLLIYGDEQAEAGLSQEEFNELVQAYFRYDDELRQAGKYVFAEALQPNSTAPCSGGRARWTSEPPKLSYRPEGLAPLPTTPWRQRWPGGPGTASCAPSRLHPAPPCCLRQCS